MSEKTEERIVNLEVETAHLRQANDELSDELAKQWKRIELLEKTMTGLHRKIEEMESTFDIGTGGDKPPHW